MRFTEEQEPSTSPGPHRDPPHSPPRRRSETDDSNPLQAFDSVIVVSNRQPYRHEYDEPEETDADSESMDRRSDERGISVDRPTGGLTAGLDPVLQRTGGTWIAWGDGDADEDVTDDSGCVAVPPEEPAYTLRRVWLDEDQVDSYYYGFSNRVLWPLCHELPDLIDLRSGDVDGYREVNRTFADAVADHATEKSLVWLQDYHLGLAPAMIRESVPSSTTIGQFWHIPWPDTDGFRHCPNGRELLTGLLGTDLLGFHVDRYVDRFLDCVASYLPRASVDRDRATVRHDGSITRVRSTPMGVDAESNDRESRRLDGSRLDDLREEYDVPADVTLGVGVDRLDYTKGIPERLEAIERFFERSPDWRGSFTFVQKGTPSRTEISAYEELGECVRHEVERINDRFATPEWRPIVYTEDYLPRADLRALYCGADLLIVSSLRDGMNLVAQEYVACSVDETGALLLSERVGAHDTLGDAAYTIDPGRPEQIATTIESALSAPPVVNRRRMRALRRRVFDLDLEWWMSRQFEELARAGDGRPSAEERWQSSSIER